MTASTIHPVGLVLVIDDEPIIRMEVVDALSEAGFQVVEASDGRQALEILHSRATEFASLFTDVHMPGLIDGLALVHEASRCWPWLGLLVASGKLLPAKDELPRKCHFLQKPYEMAHVIHHMREITKVA